MKMRAPLSSMDAAVLELKVIKYHQEGISSPSNASSLRDMVFEHQRTRACEALHKLPSFMPIDSGEGTTHRLYYQTSPDGHTSPTCQIWIIRKWAVHVSPSIFHLSLFDSDIEDSLMQEIVTTMVLIPVAGGLMELFVSKHVEEDEELVEFVMAQCNMNLPWEYQEGKQISDHMASL